jgi:hypothetical protein
MKDVDRKAPIVRSFTISGGTFRDEIVIDYRLPPPPPPSRDGIMNSSFHSLPSKFTQSDSLGDGTDASFDSTTQIKPNVKAIEVRKIRLLFSRTHFAQSMSAVGTF